jgi:hypothetical protein
MPRRKGKRPSFVQKKPCNRTLPPAGKGSFFQKTPQRPVGGQFRTEGRSQAGTEYLTVLGAILMVAGIVVVLVLPSGGSQAGIGKAESDSFWKSSYPFSIAIHSIRDGNLILDIYNSGTEQVVIKSVGIEGTNRVWFSLDPESGELGGELCNDADSCGIRLPAASHAVIASPGFYQSCPSSSSAYSLSGVSIGYSSAAISGHRFTGKAPLVGTCSLSINFVAASACNSSVTVPMALDRDITFSGAGACFNITANDVAFDCRGFSIRGDNAESSYGIWTNDHSVTIRNCNISEFSTAIYSGGDYSTLLRNTIRVPGNSTPNPHKWQGIHLDGNFFAKVKYNTITNVSANNFTGNSASDAYLFPSGILLYSARNATVTRNNVTSAGAFAPGILLYQNAEFNDVSFNSIRTYGPKDAYGISLLGSPAGNGVQSNSINTSGYRGIGIRLLNSDLNEISQNDIFTRGDSGYGISVYSGSDNNTGRQNTIRAIGPNSIGMLFSLRSLGNNFSSNAVAIDGSGSYGVYFTHYSNFTNLSFNAISTFNANSVGLFMRLSSCNNTFLSNAITTLGSGSIGVEMVSGARDNSFFGNKISTDAAATVQLGWVSNPQTYSNNSASFTGDNVTCTGTCPSSLILNQSSQATFTNVHFDASKALIGNNADWNPNNLTVRWYADVSVEKPDGSPYPGLSVNLSNSSGAVVDRRQADGSGLILGWPVSEYLKIGNSTGNYFYNYTPHSFTPLNPDLTPAGAPVSITISADPLSPVAFDVRLVAS